MPPEASAGVCGDVFKGGVLCTLSASVMNYSPFVLRLGPVRKLALPSGLLFGYTQIMGKSIKVHPKKRRGRPSTGGKDPLVSARLPKPLVAELEVWAVANGIGRSEAIRRLVELGLKK